MSATTTNNLTLMLTINGLFKKLKAENPESELTLYFIRQLIVTGQIPSIKAGRKYLVNYEAFCQFLSGNAQPQPQEQPLSAVAPTSKTMPFSAVKGIRRVY